MPVERGISATMTPPTKTPRTERGRKTLRLLLDAAAAEFGEKGFHDSSVVSITQRAGVALGSFYTYFDSKDALFRALVRDMSAQVRKTVGPVMAAESDRLDGERKGLAEFLSFVRQHKELYRIIDEAEFVDPESYRAHYENTVTGYVASLKDAAKKGQVRHDVEEVHAWAIVGMNVFLGLRFGVMSEDRDVEEVADKRVEGLTLHP
jgi:AcrR family transcriptional regulator